MNQDDLPFLRRNRIKLVALAVVVSVAILFHGVAAVVRADEVGGQSRYVYKRVGERKLTIDFDYPPWHTAEDTIDKLSAESLRIVGTVTLYYLAQEARR